MTPRESRLLPAAYRKAQEARSGPVDDRTKAMLLELQGLMRRARDEGRRTRASGEYMYAIPLDVWAKIGIAMGF